MFGLCVLSLVLSVYASSFGCSLVTTTTGAVPTVSGSDPSLLELSSDSVVDLCPIVFDDELSDCQKILRVAVVVSRKIDFGEACRDPHVVVDQIKGCCNTDEQGRSTQCLPRALKSLPKAAIKARIPDHQ